MTPPNASRLRRLRRSDVLRDVVRETRLSPDQLVWPLFVAEGVGSREAIDSMPGQHRLGIEALLQECESAVELGLRSVLLFGVAKDKDDAGSGAYRGDGVVQRAVEALKKRDFPLLVMTDTCLCAYTTHGHCGVLERGVVANDATLPLLARAAVSQARAGADVVAPSDMMDGRVAAIRAALDVDGHEDVAILSYAVKYASAFYGPFREAAASAPAAGDRRSHQMDPGNRREAVREARQDVAEGADVVMVKPALAYLDVVREVRNAVDVPVAAYSVSGEYAMIEAAARNGWIDREAVVMESLVGMARAGADLLLTYHAPLAISLLSR